MRLDFLQNNDINYIERVFSGLSKEDEWCGDVLGGVVSWAKWLEEGEIAWGCRRRRRCRPVCCKALGKYCVIKQAICARGESWQVLASHCAGALLYHLNFLLEPAHCILKQKQNGLNKSSRCVQRACWLPNT